MTIKFSTPLSLFSSNIVLNTLCRRFYEAWLEAQPTREEIDALFSSVRNELMNVHTDGSLNEMDELYLVEALLNELEVFISREIGPSTAL
ncbi:MULTISPECIES: hypothetical protein [Agrobacterium]|uniref:Uncharacterized protein n=1 Tax=Agrobacterium tumefaciens TaxID=358 RepID=A0AAW8M2T1_AGRTU|nr:MULTISPECIES: hypothetical protein [Agrobacterium]MBP2568478.1 hypothetical protein [Agrobacterium tumefaciens]MDR6705386.1 hypothetical protein [Agrobacterium tumefaciens]TCV45260.1 hypothetical protein EDB97_12117 [Agrobacterium tumefaciens]